MGLTAKEGGQKFDQIPEGVYGARCFAIYDLGTQAETWQGEEKQMHKVLFMWEIPELRITVKDKTTGEEKDLPRAISNRYTLSLGDKAKMRAHLESWRGKAFTNAELEGFDLKNILGKACQLQVIHNESGGKTYANITSVMALPKGMTVGPQETESKFFSFEDGGQIPEGTPEWVRKLICESAEAKAQAGHPATDKRDEPDDTLPF